MGFVFLIGNGNAMGWKPYVLEAYLRESCFRRTPNHFQKTGNRKGHASQDRPEGSCKIQRTILQDERQDEVTTKASDLQGR